MIILQIIFVLFIAEIIYIAFFTKEKPVRFKQIVYKNSRKMYRIDHLRKGLRW